MTVRVLQSKSEIHTARRELRRRKLSCLRGWQSQILRRIMRKLRWTPSVQVGDAVKSWDVLTTAQFIRQNVAFNAPILDIGAFASEIPYVLHRLGYSDLVGIDLNPEIYRMPDANAIHYLVADLLATPFRAESFGAITAVSVIEHGFQSQALLQQVARLLRPGGYFIASFDYWQPKIDTTGLEIFGMDWKIFSADDVNRFLDQARAYALQPIGAIDLSVGAPTMKWAGKQYTFAWLAVQKSM